MVILWDTLGLSFIAGSKVRLTAEEVMEAVRVVRAEVDISEEMLKWDGMPDNGLDLMIGAQVEGQDVRI